jgi:hypothetical protein
MLVQQDGHKVGRTLEKIIENEVILKGIHGSVATTGIIAKAQAMLDLLTASYTHFNIAHNGVFLDLDDFQFLKDHSDKLLP